MKYAFANARIFTGEAFQTGHTLLTENEKIIGFAGDEPISPDFQVIDLQGQTLVPGFIDLQIYGGGGRLFSNDISPEAIAATYDSHKHTGTTGFLITLSSSPFEKMMQAIEVAEACLEQKYPGFLGLHLEGPYFNPIKRGAHVAACIRQPNLAEVRAIVEKGSRSVKYLTLAPEMCSEEVLDYLLQSPVVVSAGHSNATYPQAVAAFERGISRVTHLFNAMSQLQGREPGLVGATYDTQVQASIIADGIHCDFASLRISHRIMGNRLFLITDAVTESESGSYKFRASHDRFVDDNGVLAGSALTMIQAIKNCVEKADIPLTQALNMASLYPAQALNASHYLGKIQAGYQANFVVLDDALTIKAVVQDGKPI